MPYVRKRKRSTKKKNRMLHIKQGALVVLGLVIVVFAGLLTTGAFKPQPTDGYVAAGETTISVIASAMQPDATANPAVPTTKETSASDSNTTPDASGNTAGAATPAPDSNTTPTAKVTPGPAVTPKATPTATPTAPTKPAATTAPTDPATDITDDVTPASADWLEARIQRHKDEINEQDLIDFRVIIAKLDQSYIGGLAVDGFSTEEATKLKEHMAARLTGTQYERAKSLFYTYNYLLDEDA